MTVGYWLTVELACLALRRDFAYSLPQLLYALGFTMRGLGFIWVAIIFFWGTLLGPFFLQLSACIRSNLAFAGLLAGGFALNQLLWQLNQRLATADAPLWLQLLLNDYLNQWLAYLLVILAGVRLLEEKNFKYHLLALGVIALMLGQCWLGCGFCPNNYKYPPHLYYLGYGLSVAMLLWGLFTPSIHMRWLEWFSRHSWDIYLVHILFYVGTVFLHHWMARYVVVLAGSIVTIILLEAVKAKLRYANRTPMAYKVGPG